MALLVLKVKINVSATKGINKTQTTVICIANKRILYMDVTIRLQRNILKIPLHISFGSLSQRLRKTIETVKSTYKLSTDWDVRTEKIVSEILST